MHVNDWVDGVENSVGAHNTDGKALLAFVHKEDKHAKVPEDDTEDDRVCHNQNDVERQQRTFDAALATVVRSGIDTTGNISDESAIVKRGESYPVGM